MIIIIIVIFFCLLMFRQGGSSYSSASDFKGIPYESNRIPDIRKIEKFTKFDHIRGIRTHDHKMEFYVDNDYQIKQILKSPVSTVKLIGIICRHIENPNIGEIYNELVKSKSDTDFRDNYFNLQKSIKPINFERIADKFYGPIKRAGIKKHCKVLVIGSGKTTEILNKIYEFSTLTIYEGKKVKDYDLVICEKQLTTCSKKIIADAYDSLKKGAKFAFFDFKYKSAFDIMIMDVKCKLLGKNKPYTYPNLSGYGPVLHPFKWESTKHWHVDFMNAFIFIFKK